MKQKNSGNSALIIFAKNPVAGKVKTRLAKDTGSVKALEIFLRLLTHTYNETKDLNYKKFLFLSDQHDESLFDKNYIQEIQSGNNLGEKMNNAFQTIFRSGFENAVLIGTDTPEISSEIINKAFVKLSDHDFTIGPAYDGGYYLIGMKNFNDNLFENIRWSTGEVFEKTILKIKNLNKSYFILEKLHDVDVTGDLKYMEALNIN